MNQNYIKELTQYAKTPIEKINITIPKKQPISLKQHHYNYLFTPLNIILLIIGVLSLAIDFFITEHSSNFITFTIIIVTLILSILIRFFQEYQAQKSFKSIMIETSNQVTIIKNNKPVIINQEQLCYGDLVQIQKGDIIPADLRIINANHLMVNQSVLSGESDSVVKNEQVVNTTQQLSFLDYSNIVYMSTKVVNGQGQGIVIGKDAHSVYGSYVENMNNVKKKFHYHLDKLSLVFVKYICILLPIVFIINVLIKKDIFSALLFSLSISIGLIPELLPMIINLCFVRGSRVMESKKTIVKNINAMEKLGTMDVLCTDKTGTLTNNQLILEYYLDLLGNESLKTLKYGLLNSFYTQSSYHLDEAITQSLTMPLYKEELKQFVDEFTLLDEIEFDYIRRFSSVLVSNQENYIIIKGSIEEVVNRCSFIEYNNKIFPLDHKDLSSIDEITHEMSEDGMKILAVAYKQTKVSELTYDQENEMILLGYLVFFDGPKQSAKQAIENLASLHIKSKILTGENLQTTLSICQRLNIDTQYCMTGDELDQLSLDELNFAVEKTTVFAKLNPMQKSKIVEVLKTNGHTVGYLGDGINDLSAMMSADVAISVDNAMDEVKQRADLLLLEKDLDVLRLGVIEGRKAFVNMSKYIKITASSNFGNILSIIVASVLLPFLPMNALQILMLNIIYDVLCVSLPFDDVDQDLYTIPQLLTKEKLSRFMRWFGPVSSLFDMLTFVFLYFVLCPYLCGGMFYTLNESLQDQFILLFQTSWFLECIWTQVLIIMTLRSKHQPFIESKPSKLLCLFSFGGVLLFTVLLFLPSASAIGFTILPIWYGGFVVSVVILYVLLATLAKKYFIQKYHELV